MRNFFIPTFPPAWSNRPTSWPKALLRLLSIALLLCTSIALNAQVVISEVFSNGTFELRNTGSTPVNVSDYWICNFPAYEQLQQLNVECGSLEIQGGDELVLSGFNAYDTNDAELGLYLTSAFGNSDAIISYLEWGSTGHFRSNVAVNAGIWTANNFVASFTDTESIRYDGDGIQAADWTVNSDPLVCGPGQLNPVSEAESIVRLAAQEAGRTVADFSGSNRGFPSEHNVFLPSAISLADLEDPARASARLPIYEGVGPSGEPTYFIITEATSIELAEKYGAIVSPKLRYGARPEAADAAQQVDVVNGRIIFKGDVDFSPERIVTPGSPNPFPPAFVQPGAVGDAEYSSLVVLPSGEVINAQIIANATGVHDRINEINIDERWAEFQLLDGWEGGDRFYYHLVTDASDPGPAAIELGVYAPRMANLPTFGNSELDPETVLLGFSPNVNGLTIAFDNADELNRQGLGSTIVDNDLDPVNIFPFDPDNTIEDGNNYSPMWDAHLNMWTDEAINGPNGDQRRAITSFADLFDLMDQGLVTSFAGSPGIENPFINGLRASNAVINCPVICHPFQGQNPPGTGTARLQVIHSAEFQTVQLSVDNEVVNPTFAYHTATPYFDVPAGRPVSVELVPVGGLTPASQVETFEIQLTNGGTYAAAVFGTFDSSDNLPVELAVRANATEGAGINGYVDISYFAGATDLGGIDVIENGDPLFEDVNYGQFASGFETFPAAAYTIDVNRATGNELIASYASTFDFWSTRSAILFSTGSENAGTFETWVALSTGGTFPLAPITTNKRSAAVDQASALNEQIGLLSPNPTVDETTLTYNLLEEAKVNIDVFDLTGKLVKNVFSGNLAAGTHQTTTSFQELSTGMYFYSITIDGNVSTQKLIVQ